jgi:SnoaL-like domain
MKKRIVAAAVILISSGIWVAMAQQRDGTLTIQDYVEIQQLYARYTHAIDSGERGGMAWAETFTPDGTFVNTVGRDKLAAFAKDWHENRGGAMIQHWNSNLVITPAADGAHGSCYLMLVDRKTNPVSIRSINQYDDTLVKTREGWRFKRRAFVPAKPAPTAAQ